MNIRQRREFVQFAVFTVGYMAGTPLTVGSPQEVIEKTLTFQEGFGDYQRQLFAVDGLGLAELPTHSSPDCPERSATELAMLLCNGAPGQIAYGNWARYQHQFAGNATRAQRWIADIDFTTDLIRLASGGGPKSSAN